MVKTSKNAPRQMKPVVELRKRGDSYTYGVRAPRAGGVIPPVSYRDGGFPTLGACLLDVARGLGGNFPRVYVRLEGACVGERDIAELRRLPEQVARELEAELDLVRDAAAPGGAATVAAVGPPARAVDTARRQG